MKALRKIFTRLDDLRRGDRRLYYLPEARRELLLPQEENHSRQWDRLIRMIDFAYRNNPFYHERMREAGVTPESIQDPSDLLRIPALLREDIRKNQKQLLTPSLGSEDFIETATGGTTDSPIKLLIDKETVSRRRAATLFFYKWLGYEIGDPMAVLWGAEQDIPKYSSFKSRTRERLVGKVLFLPSSYLNDEIMYEYYNNLKEFKPKVLQAYPTPLYYFACFLERNNLQLPIKNINVTAEYLYEYQREKIETIFNTKIFNWYGSRDLGHAATECRFHNGLHLNTYGLYVEVIKDGKQVLGEAGELIFTELFNRAMPLIRYKIGDLGSLSYEQCPCGSGLPLIKEVGGRYTDSFKKRDGSYIPGVAFTNRIVKDCTGIEQLQIIQKSFDEFQLNIVKGSRYNDEETNKIRDTICQYMHDRLHFNVAFVDKILPEKSGKILFCKSEIK